MRESIIGGAQHTRCPINGAKDKGKQKLVEAEVSKKRKLQERIDAQVTREIEEEFARENQRLSEQLARDSEIARLYAEEELKRMIEGLDRRNEVISKHLQEYEQAEADLTVGEKIELINELVKYQDHHAKILKYQAQQSKPLLKKEQRKFYMSVLKSHVGWKTRHFRGMTLEEIKEKLIPVWKQFEDFVPVSSKEEGERLKRQGLKIDQGSSKRMKTSEDVSEQDLKGMIESIIGGAQHMRCPIIRAKDKGKQKVVKSEVPKKRKLQEQIDAQVAREMEEEFARENQRLSKQLTRDSKIARLHAEEELKRMIEGLDRSNEVIAKHLQECEQAEADLTVEEKIELINELVKYQDHHAKILKYQAQHSKPLSKKEQKEFYMSFEDFVPMSSKEEGERVKRQGLKIEQGSSKRIKTFEDVSKEDLKWMMQLVPLEKVYVEALQAIKDKEKELWVELKRLFKPDFEDQLWIHNQAFIHDRLDWKLYDTCSVHHVSTKDQEIFMLVEKDYPLRKGLATIDAQVAREMEEEFARENQRLSKQLARDSEIARLHAEEELKRMIEDLDRSNEVIAKHLQEYEQAEANLTVREKIELINELVKYQDHHAKILKGMTLEENKEKIIPVWKQFKDFMPMSSKEEGERVKRQGLKIDQGSSKRMKTFEDVSEEDLKGMMQLVPLEKSLARDSEITRLHAEEELKRMIEGLDRSNEVIEKHLQEYEQAEADLTVREKIELINELVKYQDHHAKILKQGLKIDQGSSKRMKTSKDVSEEDLKGMMQLVPLEEVYVEALQVKHPIIDWELYDTCGAHHVSTKDQKIFMLVEKDYPLRKGLAIVMISDRLQVEQYSQMANDLILKIYNIANSPR
nr:hypothetical protein [Tanacetum cinerariifolium]